MFCPNCGNNCGDARFCPSCGTKLQQAADPATQSGEWKVGMPCPNCGATKLNGDCCAFCGAQLIFNIISSDDIPEDSFVLPTISLSGWGGSILELHEDGFTYHYRERLISPEVASFVPYSAISAITYSHRKSDEYEVIVKDVVSKKGITTFTVSHAQYMLYQLFCYLETVVPKTAQIIVKDTPYPALENLMKRFDTDVFFECYNPYFNRASEKIEELTGMRYMYANGVAEAVIKTRQKTLYAIHPELAIRDLNRAITERQREEEERERKMEEKLEASRQRSCRTRSIRKD